MHEILRQRIISNTSDEEKISKTREFLQVLMLKMLFDRGAFDNLALVGGTALRVLYGLRRYSAWIRTPSAVSRNSASVSAGSRSAATA